MSRPSAVTFDFWNTLVVEPSGLLAGRRRVAVAQAIGDHVRPDGASLDRLLADAGRLHDRAWRAGAAFRPEDAARALADALPGLDDARRADVVSAYVEAGAGARLTLAPGAATAVRALAETGVPLAIVCDVGLTGSPHLRRFLDEVGLLDAFSAWAFSDEVGTFKPDPRIFRHALAGLGGVDPAAAVHVGDLRRTDVAGARAIGMRAVRYRGVADDPAPGPEGDLVVDDLGELTPAVLAALVAPPAHARTSTIAGARTTQAATAPTLACAAGPGAGR